MGSMTSLFQGEGRGGNVRVCVCVCVIYKLFIFIFSLEKNNWQNLNVVKSDLFFDINKFSLTHALFNIYFIKFVWYFVTVNISTTFEPFRQLLGASILGHHLYLMAIFALFNRRNRRINKAKITIRGKIRLKVEVFGIYAFTFYFVNL